jgi:hypothetical protein
LGGGRPSRTGHVGDDRAVGSACSSGDGRQGLDQAGGNQRPARSCRISRRGGRIMMGAQEHRGGRSPFRDNKTHSRQHQDSKPATGEIVQTGHHQQSRRRCWALDDGSYVPFHCKYVLLWQPATEPFPGPRSEFRRQGNFGPTTRGEVAVQTSSDGMLDHGGSRSRRPDQRRGSKGSSLS